MHRWMGWTVLFQKTQKKTEIGKYRFNMKSGQVILASTFEANFLVQNYLQSPPALILNNPLIFLFKMGLLCIYISNICGKMSCFSCKEKLTGKDSSWQPWHLWGPLTTCTIFPPQLSADIYCSATRAEHESKARSKTCIGYIMTFATKQGQ